ncbi:MAG: hypothetical protein VB082_09165 [Christensenella sp.]|nr:hypothetical protein [Christensenella sp.]
MGNNSKNSYAQSAYGNKWKSETKSAAENKRDKKVHAGKSLRSSEIIGFPRRKPQENNFKRGDHQRGTASSPLEGSGSDRPMWEKQTKGIIGGNNHEQ